MAKKKKSKWLKWEGPMPTSWVNRPKPKATKKKKGKWYYKI